MDRSAVPAVEVGEAEGDAVLALRKSVGPTGSANAVFKDQPKASGSQALLALFSKCLLLLLLLLSVKFFFQCFLFLGMVDGSWSSDLMDERLLKSVFTGVTSRR